MLSDPENQPQDTSHVPRRNLQVSTPESVPSFRQGARSEPLTPGLQQRTILQSIKAPPTQDEIKHYIDTDDLKKAIPDRSFYLVLKSRSALPKDLETRDIEWDLQIPEKASESDTQSWIQPFIWRLLKRRYPVCIVVDGEKGSGKTHTSLRGPDNTAIHAMYNLFDFARRADATAAKVILGISLTEFSKNTSVKDLLSGSLLEASDLRTKVGTQLQLDQLPVWRDQGALFTEGVKVMRGGEKLYKLTIPLVEDEDKASMLTIFNNLVQTGMTKVTQLETSLNEFSSQAHTFLRVWALREFAGDKVLPFTEYCSITIIDLARHEDSYDSKTQHNITESDNDYIKQSRELIKRQMTRVAESTWSEVETDDKVTCSTSYIAPC